MISYAQNFEDAMLARLFPNKRDGFYVDVGAHDPTIISVTRYFYDLGWHGINIEPVPDDFAKFVRDRPRDINLQLAVGDHPGKGTIHIVDGSSDSCELGSALSSMDAEEAREGAALVGNLPIRSVDVEVATLADILARHCPDTPIDFLKIDVEGWEAKVLAGADFRRFRPIALVIEATKSGAPLTDWANPESIGEWSEWEPGLLAEGYVFAHFDGLNRFYIRQEDAALVKRFQLPPGIYDNIRFADIRSHVPASTLTEYVVGHATDQTLAEEIREARAAQENEAERRHSAEADLRAHKAYVVDLQKSVESLTRENAAVAETARQAESARADFVSRLKVADEREAALSRQIAVWTERHGVAETLAATLSKQLAEESAHSRELEAARDAIRSEAERQTKANQVLSAKLETESARSHELEAARDEIRSEAERQTKANQMLAAKLATESAHSRELEAALDDARAEPARQTEAAQILSANIQRLTATLDELRQANNALEEKAKETMVEHQTTAARFENERKSLQERLAAEEVKRRAAEEREIEQLRENDRLRRLARDAENASVEFAAERDSLVEELEDIRNERNALAREAELRRYENAEKAFRRRYRWWFRAVAVFPPLARLRRHFDLGHFQEKDGRNNDRARPPDGPLGDRPLSGKENAEAVPSQPTPSGEDNASQAQAGVLPATSKPISGPKISVITPSFNSGDTLERAILSVRAQAAQYPNYEHWVIDGGSTDETLAILRKYPEVKWVSEPDKGQSDAMNKGFGKATGEVVVYLNADDELAPGAFAAVIPSFNAGAKVVMGKVRVIQENNHTDWINDPATDHESMLRHWEPNAFCVNPVGYYYRREVQEQVPFDIANPDKMDLEFLLGVSARFPIQKVDAVLGTFHYSADCKTGREAVRFNYWQPREFAFLDPYIESLPKEKQTEFRRRQAAGYQARRSWVVEGALTDAEAIAKGRADALLVSLPRPDDGYFLDDGSGHHLASRGDAVIIVLESDNPAKTQAILAFLRGIPRPYAAYPVYRVNPLEWRAERGRAGKLKKAFRRLGGAVTWIELDASHTPLADIPMLLGIPHSCT